MNKSLEFKNSIATLDGIRFGQRVRSKVDGLEGIVEAFEVRASGSTFVGFTSISLDGQHEKFNSKTPEELEVVNNDKVQQLEKIFKESFKEPKAKIGDKVCLPISDSTFIVGGIHVNYDGKTTLSCFREYYRGIPKHHTETEYISDNTVEVIDSKLGKIIEKHNKAYKEGTLKQFDEVKSIITGFTGVVTQIMHSSSGVLITVQEKSIDNKPGMQMMFPESTLELIKPLKEEKVIDEKPTGCFINPLSNVVMASC